MNRTQLRPGFTIMEMSIAFALLAIVFLIVAQVSYWSLTHRLESIARHLALEHANNIMEAARATPYENLTDQWAADLGLPPDAKPYLPDGQVGVTVEPEPNIPGVKRVTVEISWTRNPGLPSAAVKLVALFAGKQEAKK